MNNGIALSGFIQATLPIQIARYQRNGGVSDLDIDRAKSFADELASHGDTLLFGGKPGEAGRLAGQLVDALAVMTLTSSNGLESIERWVNDFNGSFKKHGEY